MNGENLNLGLHTYMSITLVTDPSPQSFKCVFLSNADGKIERSKFFKRKQVLTGIGKPWWKEDKNGVTNHDHNNPKNPSG